MTNQPGKIRKVMEPNHTWKVSEFLIKILAFQGILIEIWKFQSSVAIDHLHHDWPWEWPRKIAENGVKRLKNLGKWPGIEFQGN